MSVLSAVLGILLTVGVGWKSYQLVRTPDDHALRAVTGCLACAWVAYPFGLEPVDAAVDGAVGAGVAMLVQNAFLCGCVYALMCFFLYSAQTGRPGRRARFEAIPLAGTVVVLVVATFATPAAERGAGYSEADMTVAGVATFYLVAGAYLSYALATAARWTWRYARRSRRPLSIGLWLAFAGMAGMVLGATVRFVLTVLRASGFDTPHPLVDAMSLLLALAIPTFVLGIIFPAVATRVAAVHVWWQHRRLYRRLEPLWTVLHTTFPQDALDRVPTSRWREAVSLRGVNRRYYRRVIECRDGLVRVSPRLAGSEPADSSDAMAESLLSALREHRDGAPVEGTAALLAGPAEADITSDVRQLIALSDAVRARRREQSAMRRESP